MKRNILAFLSLGVMVTSCVSPTNKTMDSQSIKDKIKGVYVRNGINKVFDKSYAFNDTLKFAPKDKTVEVTFRSKINGELKSPATAQYDFNLTDSTLTHMEGYTIKIEIDQGRAYMVNKPREIYNKVK